jgi:pilus assembly protein CpaE
MKQLTHQDESLQVTLLTVCIEQDLVDKIRETASDMPWAIVATSFEHCFSASKRPHLNQQMVNSGGCIALIDLDGELEPALETAEFLRDLFPGKIAIIGLSSGMQSDLLLRAMRAGCSEVLNKPFDTTQFRDALVRADRRWSNTVTRQQKSGQILSFFGAKGGVGTTTLAVHLGIFLVSVCKKKVILIDSHEHLGHVCLYLGLDGNRYHFNELVRNVNRLDQDLLRGFIAKHSSGLDALSSPDAFDAAHTSSADSIRHTLEFLSEAYDFVLLDCEMSFDDITRAAVTLSTYAYLISSPEVTSIRDLSRYVDSLIQHEFPTDKLQVVINRYSPRDAVGIEQIEKAVRLPVAIKIGNHYKELLRFINMGEPVDPTRKSEFASQVLHWATSLSRPPSAVSIPAAKKRFALWS